MSQRFFSGIEGLTGREPIGGVLRIGQKSSKGYPTDTDRFFICSPGLDSNKVRPLHPSFGGFNSAKPEARRIIRGRLYHEKAEDAYNAHLQAYILPKPWGRPPSREPVCSGDGIKARRWYGGEDGEYRDQKGCGDLCEFRQESNKHCKPSARLYFYVTWAASALQPGEGRDGWPEIFMRFDTGAWSTAANLKGFFDLLATMTDDLRGVPFVLELGLKTNPAKGRAFPVVSISPEGDLMKFFHERRKLLDGTKEAPKLIGATSPEENSPDVIEGTAIELSAGIPGQGSLLE